MQADEAILHNAFMSRDMLWLFESLLQGSFGGKYQLQSLQVQMTARDHWLMMLELPNIKETAADLTVMQVRHECDELGDGGYRMEKWYYCSCSSTVLSFFSV